MDVNFTEEQEMLRKAAKAFLVKECPKSVVRQLEEDEKGYSPEIWEKMTGLGWTGLVIPEKYDGMGMTFQDLTVLMEEMGANILPGPFFCTMIEGAMPILLYGSEEQKKELLPKIATGKLIVTMAFLEGHGNCKASQISCKAVPKGDSYVINGTKLFVEQANVADRLICVTRTGETASVEDGITLFIVDAGTAGVACEVMPTMGQEKLCEVRFTDVVVPKNSILGGQDKGWPVVERIIRQASIAKCAESIGGMQSCLDMTVAYSKERVQYNRPIGSFQVLQHVMADMWILTLTGKYLVYMAAWMESEGMNSAKEASMAKAYVNEAYKWVSTKAVQLHGGIGTSREHDIGLYYRRAKTADLAFGGTDFHRDLVATGIGMRG